MPRYFPLLLVLVIGIEGCSMMPAYQRPTIETAPTFSEGTTDWKVANPQPLSLNREGWKQFGDPILVQLEDELLTNNLSLKQAEAQYRQVKAISDAAPLALWPTLSANVSSLRRKNAVASNSSATSTAPVSIGSNAQSITTSSSALFSSQWEVDVWGRIRAQYEGSLTSTAASAEDLAQAKVSLQAALASAYMSLRVLDAQSERLKAIGEAYRRVLTLMEVRVKAGVVSAIDIETAKGQLKAAETQYLAQLPLRAQQEHLMAVLLGRSPSVWKLAPRKAQLPFLGLQLPAISLTLPSTLLERRPDIAAAERRVASANAQMGVAKAAWFPSFTLGASLGEQSAAPWARFFSLPSLVWSLGPSLAYSILDSGARSVQTQQVQAGYDMAVANYKQTALVAFQEVEDQLSLLSELEKEVLTQQEALDSAERKLSFIRQQKQAGLISKLDQLDGEIALLVQENSFLATQEQRFLNRVALIKVSGGS
jgi:NodT family efflux transporter outer membrane factor (OMF) lipoprotein